MIHCLGYKRVVAVHRRSQGHRCTPGARSKILEAEFMGVSCKCRARARVHPLEGEESLLLGEGGRGV